MMLHAETMASGGVVAAIFWRVFVVGLLLLFLKLAASDGDGEFIYNGFSGADLSLDGTAEITPSGLLRLTNTTKLLKGHGFYPFPVRFKGSQAGNVFSFSSTFVFGIVSENTNLSGHGIALVISPSKDFHQATGTQYLGLFNQSNNGKPANHILAVELDTILNPELKDINSNHVGIDVNSLISIESSPAGYFPDDDGGGGFKNLSLISGDPMQVWAEFDASSMLLNVTLSPMDVPKPSIPLLSAAVNLSDIFFDSMYVGFSSSSDPFLTSHYILGWSFKVNGKAQALNVSSLPSLPLLTTTSKRGSVTLAIWLSCVSVVSVLVIAAGIVYHVRRRNKFSELLEDWELAYEPHRFSYKTLFEATRGFRDEQLLGFGGFGRVYRGILPESKIDVAVKRVSHESRQGIKEFIAEIVSIGRLRHRNLVQLLGYCRRKGELLLVYDFMPNGSLDQFLFDKTKCPLDWGLRFQIIKGIAAGLLYLHEEWEQVVIHRDVKASNVLLDGELNARLGDFGLARLYDHGTDPQTTHVVGTMGYLAPELTRTGKATKATDVFAFGAFLLEVVCGRRPIQPEATGEELILLEWALKNWERGDISKSKDPRLVGSEFAMEQVELVLKLGLLCCHPLPDARPTMRQMMQFLDGDIPVPKFSSDYLSASVHMLRKNEFDHDCVTSYPSSFLTVSFINEGR